MKLYVQIIFILIVFFQTGNLLSDNKLLNVNNIQLQKKDKSTNEELANQAIKTGFNQLITKILLTSDSNKLSNLSFEEIKKLVTYYQTSNISNESDYKNFVNFSVTFDKDKIHDLFYKKGISYSDVLDNELYILPILIKENEIHVFNNNFFYEHWNKIHEKDLIEFILPLENIEIFENINKNKNNLINLKISSLFKEYEDKNLALILIEDNKNNIGKIYIKSLIEKKNISKSFKFKKSDLKTKEFYEEIIKEIKNELINLVKSKNLIDISTPSFLNVKLNLNNNNNLVSLNSRIKNIDLIENIYVEEFNKDFMKLRIKYLGKLDKIINQLKKEKINLQLVNDMWIIKTL